MEIIVFNFLKTLFKKRNEVKVFVPKKDPCSPKKQHPCSDCVCEKKDVLKR